MTEKPSVERFIASPHFSSRNGTKISRIVLHYTAGGTALGALSWWQQPQSQVSAHYVIERDGNLYQAVKDAHKAWHARNANPESVGIEFVADKGDRMTPEQEVTGVQLVRHLVETYSVPWENINGHRYTHSNLNATDCPGDLFGERTEAAVLDWVATKCRTDACEAA